MLTKDKLLITGGISITSSIIISAVLTWYLVTSHIDAFEADQPRIAIAGYGSVQKMFELDTPPEVMAASFEDLNRKIDRLKELGYIIIDERVVMTAPDQFRVPARKVSVGSQSLNSEPDQVAEHE